MSQLAKSLKLRNIVDNLHKVGYNSGMLADVILIGSFIAFAVLGYARGFVKSVVLLVRVSFSVIIAFLLANPAAKLLNSLGFAGLMSNIFGTTESNGRIISIAIMTIVIFIILRLILNKFVNLAERAREKSRAFGIADHWLGALLGALRFMFTFCIIAVAFRLITLLPIISGLHDIVFDGSVVALWLYELVTKTILSGAINAMSGVFL